jgi:uncharacterized protein
MLAVLSGLIAVGAVAYVAVCALLFFTQENAIFAPGPNDARLRQQHARNRVEIPGHGVTIEGWWLENPDATNEIVILYFGGNAEDVLYTAETLRDLNARRMLVTNYRGYGESTGNAGQEALYEDGLSAYDYALSRGARPDQIVVMGRSLGSGVASMLAGSRPLKAAVLITPFDDLASVAAGHYPYIPVRWLLRHPFRSTDWAAKAHAPALLLAAASDFIIPASHAARLAEAWAGGAELHVLPGTGHNDIEQNPDYYRLINEFFAARSGRTDADQSAREGMGAG